MELLQVCYSFLAPQSSVQVADYKFLSTGSAAAAYQAFAYGAFTPAGGIFAGLTSMAMTGLYPLFALVLSVAFVSKDFGWMTAASSRRPA